MKQFQPFPAEEEYLEQMKAGKLLNPRIDSTFKALFTQPTKESRSALKSFLEAATERKIKDFELEPNDSPAGFLEQRGVSYDILCEFDDGSHADIEMQAFNQKYDYGKRAEYQAARLENTYLARGESWENAPQVYQITVLDFPYDKKSDKAVSRYAMRTEDGRELSNRLNVVFIDLTKLKVLEQDPSKNSLIENWALFLKNADNPKKNDIIEEITSTEAGLMEAKKSLSSISKDRSNWIAQYRQEIFERDRISSQEASHREGLEQGIEQGIEQGLKQGIKQGAAQQKAEDDRLIAQITAQKDALLSSKDAENAKLRAEIDLLKKQLGKAD